MFIWCVVWVCLCCTGSKRLACLTPPDAAPGFTKLSEHQSYFKPPGSYNGQPVYYTVITSLVSSILLLRILIVVRMLLTIKSSL